MEKFTLKNIGPCKYACMDCGLLDISGGVYRDEDVKKLEAERDALKSELSDCKADLAAYEAQWLDDDTFSLLVASYERKISQLEADNERLRKALEAIREYLMGGIWIYSKSPDEFIKTALAAKEGGGDD